MQIQTGKFKVNYCPANAEAARLYSDSRKDYNKRVRETVEESWK
jgi:ubiquitin-protein ligase